MMSMAALLASWIMYVANRGILYGGPKPIFFCSSSFSVVMLVTEKVRSSALKG